MNKVRPGDPLSIPADAFNTFVDAARAMRNRQHDQRSRGQPSSQRADIVMVRNDSSAVVSRFGALAITGPIIDPAVNELAFSERVILAGDRPTTTGVGVPVVPLDPIPAGRFGRAVVCGVAIARVAMASESHGFADLVAAGTLLGSANAGPATLAWVQPPADREVAGIALCVVLLGARSSGASGLVGAMITSKTGALPPFRYAAAEAVRDADGVWSLVEDGAAYNDVFVLDESGSAGQWVGPLEIGTPVVILPGVGGNESTLALRSVYRGTYP